MCKVIHCGIISYSKILEATNTPWSTVQLEGWKGKWYFWTDSGCFPVLCERRKMWKSVWTEEGNATQLYTHCFSPARNTRRKKEKQAKMVIFRIGVEGETILSVTFCTVLTCKACRCFTHLNNFLKSKKNGKIANPRFKTKSKQMNLSLSNW